MSHHGRKASQVQAADLAKVVVEDVPRVRCKLVGPAVAGAVPFVSVNNLYNALKAVLCRVFRAPKYPARVGPWASVRRLTDALLPGFFDEYQPMDVHQWISEAPARRRKAFERALELLKKGWSDEWEWFGSFIKSEKLPDFEPYGDGCEAIIVQLAHLVDRLIQGPHDCTHLIAGPLLKPVTRRLKEVWNVNAPIFYAAVSVEKLDLWFNRVYSPNSWGLMCDYTMFDNSHSHYSWDWVESLYRRLGLFELEPRLAQVLRAWREPKGRMHGKGWTIKYRAYVMNASGRDDTALANALLNGAAMFLSLVSVYARKPVVALTEADVRHWSGVLNLSICGDDSLAVLPYLPVTEEVFRSELSAALASFGFTAGSDKMKISREPFDFVYLGMRPHCSEGKWYFAKTIGRALWKFGWQLDKDGDVGAWMAGNCEQVVATQQIVPILYDTAEAYLEGYWGPVNREEDLYRPWQRTTATPLYDSDVVRYLARGYGVSYAEFCDCIVYVRRQRCFPCVLCHPVLTKILCVDEM